MANITDKFGRAGTPTSSAPLTTVKTARSVGGTVLEGFSLAGFTEDTPVFFITYKKTTDPVTGEITVVNKASWKALANVTSNTLTNLTIAPGYTDVGNAVGDYIEVIPTSFWTDNLVEGLSVSHNQDGSLKTSALALNAGSTGDVLTKTSTGSEWQNKSNSRCLVYRESNLTSLAVSSWTSIPWTHKRYDPSNMHSTSTNTNRITVARQGWYSYFLTIRFSSAVSIGGIKVKSYNSSGMNIVGGNMVFYYSSVSILTLSGEAYFNAGDYVTAEYYQNVSGNSITGVFNEVENYPRLSLAYIGE